MPIYPPAKPATRALLGAGSGLLLGLCFLYPALYPLAWVALVPLLLALRQASIKCGYALGLLHGVVLFALGSYWMIHFSASARGYSATAASLAAAGYWLYCAQSTAVAGALYCWLQRRTELPAIITFPVLFTATLAAYPFLFPVNIAQTQSRFILALQGLDITGELGLNFILLVANAACYQWLTDANERWRRRSLALGAAFWFGWMSYGILSLSAWREKVSEWPLLKLGLVQSNAPASVTEPPPSPGFSYAYPPELALYRELARKGAELVVWPELRYSGYHELAHVREAFQNYVRSDHAALLLQDVAAGKDAYNTATLLTADNHEHIYRKIRLIPFGESVPGPNWFGINRYVTKQLFGEFYSPLKPGAERIILPFPKAGLLPLLCYEVAFAEFVAKGTEVDGKRAQIIVVQSNDVWFGRTHQPHMHQQIAQLRSVENRLPLVHVVNNGPSAVISPTGEVLFESPAGVRGGYLVQARTPAQTSATVANRFPDAPRFVIYLSAVALIVVSALGKAKRLPEAGRHSRSSPDH